MRSSTEEPGERAEEEPERDLGEDPARPTQAGRDQGAEAPGEGEEHSDAMGEDGSLPPGMLFGAAVDRVRQEPSEGEKEQEETREVDEFVERVGNDLTPRR